MSALANYIRGVKVPPLPPVPLNLEPMGDVERIPWAEAIQRMDWRQGEHVTLIGPTGAGKTELVNSLIRDGGRKWFIFLGTKRIDPTQDALKRLGFATVKDANGINPQVHSRYIVRPPWPRQASAEDVKDAHREVFRATLHRAFYQTCWTVIVDEGRYVARRLGLESELELHWLQGRSQRNTLIVNTQRPRFIPLEAYDQASHLFMWRDNDHANLVRVSEMAGLNRERVVDVVPNLGRHDVLYVQPFTGEMFITNTRWE